MFSLMLAISWLTVRFKDIFSLKIKKNYATIKKCIIIAGIYLTDIIMLTVNA
jgi:hypothetical protein